MWLVLTLLAFPPRPVLWSCLKPSLQGPHTAAVWALHTCLGCPVVNTSDPGFESSCGLPASPYKGLPFSTSEFRGRLPLTNSNCKDVDVYTSDHWKPALLSKFFSHFFLNSWPSSEMKSPLGRKLKTARHIPHFQEPLQNSCWFSQHWLQGYKFKHKQKP